MEPSTLPTNLLPSARVSVWVTFSGAAELAAASEEAVLDALLAEEAGFSSFLLEALAALELLAALDAALEEAALLAGSSCLVEGALAGASLAAGEEAAASLEEAASLSAALEAASRSGSAALELLEVLAVAVGRKSSSAVGVPRRVN